MEGKHYKRTKSEEEEINRRAEIERDYEEYNLEHAGSIITVGEDEFKKDPLLDRVVFKASSGRTYQFPLREGLLKALFGKKEGRDQFAQSVVNVIEKEIRENPQFTDDLLEIQAAFFKFNVEIALDLWLGFRASDRERPFQEWIVREIVSKIDYPRHLPKLIEELNRGIMKGETDQTTAESGEDQHEVQDEDRDKAKREPGKTETYEVQREAYERLVSKIASETINPAPVRYIIALLKRITINALKDLEKKSRALKRGGTGVKDSKARKRERAKKIANPNYQEIDDRGEGSTHVDLLRGPEWEEAREEYIDQDGIEVQKGMQEWNYENQRVIEIDKKRDEPIERILPKFAKNKRQIRIARGYIEDEFTDLTTIEEIASKLGVSEKTIDRDLKDLRESGLDKVLKSRIK